MKKIIFPLLIILSNQIIKAQDAMSASTATEIVWYGLDFTKAKFVGGFDYISSAASAKSIEIKTKWIHGWSSMIIMSRG